jgi:hypothetical protein
MKLAPIVLFTYARVDTLAKAIMTLESNRFAEDSHLFIYSDGPKNDLDESKVRDVRKFIRAKFKFKSVEIIEAERNKGLAKSIISGVTEVINVHKRVIVLEDDLITSPNFLAFINSGLDYYEPYSKVLSLAGYTGPIVNAKHDVYFTRRASSLGWATWQEKWQAVDWNPDLSSLNLSMLRREFNKMGSDLTKMLLDYKKGKINSWAIRWVYYQYINQMVTVYPTISKIFNIGTGPDATHSKDSFNRFKTPLDNSSRYEFNFNDQIEIDPYYLKQFLKQYSIGTRIKYKLLNAMKDGLASMS